MSQLEDLLQQCTVKLTLPNRMGWGTGFFVAPEWILTCAHVVQEVGQPVQVWWQKRELEAVVERSLPDPYDLALLKVTQPIDVNPPCVYLDAAIQSRDPLYLFGYPDQDFANGCPVTFHCEGLTGDEPALIKFALGQVRPGMSGAPLLNQRTGKVCGIVKFTRDRSFDLGGGAIPVRAILEQFPELVELQRSFHQRHKCWLQQMEAFSKSIPANLPRSGVVEFVGRAEAMTQLHEMLQQGSPVAVSAIAGMGGIGKTELAMQYALAYKQSYPGGLCWLQARSGDVGTQLVRFAQSCLNLNPPDGLELADQVKHCWRNWIAGEVLVVFDDVTDYRTIEPYFSPSTESRFKVLMTTRLKLGRSVQQLQLDVLDEAAALALLKSLVGSDRIQAQLDESKRLCEQLGYLPLGLELAGRYLERKADLSVAELQQRLERQQLTAKALCQTDADMTAKLGVAAAFQLSWDALSAESQQLGCGLSVFAAAPIPWTIAQQCFAQQDPEELEEQRDGELLNLHLLQRVADSTYRLHPLIREFFQSQLEQSPQADEMKRQVCRTLANAAKEIPEDATREEMTAIAPLIPHLTQVVTIWTDGLEQEDVIYPYRGLGRFYEEQGLYTEADPWYRQCLRQSRAKLGNEHPDVATSLNNLAGLYDNQGRYSEAESLYIQALDLRRQLLGDEHPDVATSLNNLAFLYWNQGRFSEAEPLYIQALDLRRRLLGEEHPDVSQSLNNLAVLYKNQGRYSEAELLYIQALALRRRLLGEEHLDVSQSLNNLAVLYDNQGRYSEAEPLYIQALELRRRLLGEEHLAVSQSINNLAVLYDNQGRYSEAEPLYIQALELRRRLLGEEHPAVATSLNNLAALYWNQGRYSEAEPLYIQALELRRQLLGDEHPDVASSLNNLALLYYDQGRYSEAEPLYLQALELRRQLLGDEHPDVGRCLDNLGMLQAAQGRQQEAEASYMSALEILEQALGAAHLWTVRCRENLDQLRNPPG